MRHQRSDKAGYGKVTVILHWASAVAILALLPLGFLMQDVAGASKLLLYKVHVLFGCLILAVTLGRIVVRVIEAEVDPPSGLSGIHLRGTQAIHVLLYLVITGLTACGLVLVVQSGLLGILRGSSQGSIPVLDQFSARTGHAALARACMALLAAHVIGVIVHQIRHGGVFARIGVGKLDRSE